MARKPTFTPKKFGNRWKLYVPGRGIVDLEAADEKDAYTKAHAYQFQYEQQKGAKVETSQPPQPPTAPQTPKAAEMIQQWTQSPSFSTPQSPQSPVTPPPSLSPSAPPTQPSLPGLSPASAPSVASKVEAAMPVDRRKKVADLLAGVATRLNVVAVAASVKLLGRVPATDEDEDAEAALKEGWALQLEELFVNHPPAPWMIILGGSAAIGLGMYTNGTPIQKKPLLAPPGGDNGSPEDEQSSVGPS